MKKISGIIMACLIWSLALVLASGCSRDSSGGGAAPEEAILEVGIVSPSRDITIGAGQPVDFHGYASGGTEPIEFKWEFDGAGSDSTLKDPGVVVFDEEGTYTVRFKAVDAEGVELGDSVTISVSAQAFEGLPLADIVSPPVNETLSQNAALTFQGAVNGGQGPYTYQWSFDGVAPDATAKNPGSVTFSNVGTYTVTFMVSDAKGMASIDAVTISVNPPTELFWVDVAGGGDHSAALRSDGTLWAWGANDFGQVGTGATTDYATPQLIGTAATWTDVAAGTYHTLGLLSDGSMWAWGANHRGQLGIGNTAPSYTPLRVGADRDWAAVAAGAQHSLALKKDGTLWVWGANSDGQVGTGDNVDHTTPQQVGDGFVWVDIAAGAFHSLALRSDRTLWAWGKNASGQLGTGGGFSFNIPMQVSLDTDWTAMAGGYSSTAALKTDGTLWAWGGTPRRVGASAYWIAPIASGGSHSAVLCADGSLWAWGSNLFGELGTGDNLPRGLPVQVGLDRNWTGVAAGYNHTIGLRADGTIWAWGLNANGQLGNGTFASSSTPVRVP